MKTENNITGSLASAGSEPAFPAPCGHAKIKTWHAGHGEFERTVEICTTGITARDYFAAAALSAMEDIKHDGTFSASNDHMQVARARWIAKSAYRIADAMLIARAQNDQAHPHYRRQRPWTALKTL